MDYDKLPRKAAFLRDTIKSDKSAVLLVTLTLDKSTQSCPRYAARSAAATAAAAITLLVALHLIYLISTHMAVHSLSHSICNSGMQLDSFSVQDVGLT
jgi:hypothetical protein